ncbi:hypothetical protein GOP47_0011735 [Adiantum capillus-veneris]|uniref:Transmembrane protein n=1 Tax=Adiantum capillus-veneris TaxID=13818 RepID=A0A9D4UUQ6_ADICA|nr:hypothetical protein GOP47_0011735 [Adiantum capillus-veneris]
MVVDAIATFLQDYIYFIFLLSLGLLGFSAGLCAPRTRRPRSEDEVDYQNQRAADGSRRPTRAGSEGGRGNYVDSRRVSKGASGEAAGELEARSCAGMSANEVSHEIRREKRESKLPGRTTKGAQVLKQRSSESSPRPFWPRSLSLGRQQERRREETINKASNGGAAGDDEEEKKGVVQRKASLTGEEVKEMADAFIARVRERLRLQRQESYEARLDRSS